MAEKAIDGMLAKNAADLAKEQEVMRIMKAFKLNPYDILDLPVSAADADIKRQYRKKSLMIHPDKFKHENGMEAFDFLKKAEGQLLDSSSRAEIDSIMNLSRTEVLKSILGAGYSTGIPDTDPRLQNLSPSYDSRIRAKAKEIFVEEELNKRRKTKVAFANEGAEKARLEEEIAKRKRKAEEQAKWEERREERVSTWRDYTAKKSKKPKKTHVLG
ncbi:hypothetical protein DB88DRAFT_58337 [Papiliotrema laurentii]|uniref:J domain-containing protein n=1 Tax=Papiliotrema laurentii TaxID=5418 RepID=A0AAD9L962_PAPLA|nr:hypothetical protein DB88DRAFT_58337 [Papiliotrema laurentii]